MPQPRRTGRWAGPGALEFVRKVLYTDKLNVAWRLKEADLVAFLGQHSAAAERMKASPRMKRPIHARISVWLK